MLLNPLQAHLVYEFAARERFAILAVNADSPACLNDVLEAARLAQSPIIIETSLWQLKGHSFGAGDAMRGIARYLADISLLANDPAYLNVPVLFHTDHIKGPETQSLISAAISGVTLRNHTSIATLRASSISLDASELSEEQNINLLSALIEHAQAHQLPVTCEMEAGVDDGITDIAVIERLVTGLDRRHPGYLALFAPGIGSQHGFNAAGFPTFSPTAVAVAKSCIEQICGRTMGIALHGSTGLSEQQISNAVAAGVTKVNWSSESLLIRATAMRDYWISNGNKISPSDSAFKVTAMDNGVQSAVSRTYIPVVHQRLLTLGSVGQGPRCLQAAKLNHVMAGNGL